MPGETENGENCISTEKLTVTVLHSPKTLSLLFQLKHFNLLLINYQW